MTEDTDRMFVRDLQLNCSIGVHAHERTRAQPVRINLCLAVARRPADARDHIDEVVCYETLADAVRDIVETGHVNLVETLAEQIAAACLSDRRVLSATVRIEKLGVVPDAAAAGVEIVRHARPRDRDD